MGRFITQPWLALIPVAFFGGLFLWRRQRTLLLPASVWLLYLIWELGLFLSCDYSNGECNIRVDLLILRWILFAVSLFGAMTFLWGLLRKRKSGEDAPTILVITGFLGFFATLLGAGLSGASENSWLGWSAAASVLLGCGLWGLVDLLRTRGSKTGADHV